jgi:hypothetical protein
MDKSAITMTADDDWWLERITMDGEQRYSERIRVGSLERPRVYVPERTCRMLEVDDGDFECTWCGALLSSDRFGFVNDDGMYDTGRMSYCPNCGARIERGGE